MSGGPGEQARSLSADGMLSRREGVKEGGVMMAVVDGFDRAETRLERTCNSEQGLPV